IAAPRRCPNRYTMGVAYIPVPSKGVTQRLAPFPSATSCAQASPCLDCLLVSLPMGVTLPQLPSVTSVDKGVA
ncbi:unnamed protein product, partial [Ilex paraguariensis]